MPLEQCNPQSPGRPKHKPSGWKDRSKNIEIFRIWGSHSDGYEDITPYSLLKFNKRFEGTSRLHLQVRKIRQARKWHEIRKKITQYSQISVRLCRMYILKFSFMLRTKSDKSKFKVNMIFMSHVFFSWIVIYKFWETSHPIDEASCLNIRLDNSSF
jgi:hypothetical protein